MNLGEWIQRHRRSILFLISILALVGLVTGTKLPVSLFPRVDYPRVVVSLESGDQPAEQMEMLVTRPVEEAVHSVPGLRGVRSTTSRGAAELSINFDWGSDMVAATLQVNAAIAQIQSTLPAGTLITTRRMDPAIFPIIAYSVVSPNHSLVQLRDLAQYQLRPLLSGIEGVARVEVSGGAQEEFWVTLDPARLQAYGLSLGDVASGLGSGNVLSAVGRLEDHYKLYLAITDSRIAGLEQLGESLIRTPGNGLVRLGEIARVERSTTPQWTRVTADGRDAVLVSVYQQPGSNSVQIVRDVKERLAGYQARLPAGVSVATWYDQSRLVLAAENSVLEAVLIGAALSALVLLVFLRDLRVTLISLAVVPAVLAITVLLLHIWQMSFNIMTLGGMAAAVGLIIDDAIVMIEHIVRRLHEQAEGQPHLVMTAALEFTRPLVGSSASTLIIFVPLAFLDGVTGAFFQAMSLTMAAGLSISFLVTWLGVPLLAGLFLRVGDIRHQPDSVLTHWLQRNYARLLKAVLARPWLLLSGVLPLLLLGFAAFQAVGSGFMPAMDEGGFVLDYYSPPGTSLSETDRLLRQVEQIIRSTPEVASYSRRTGLGFGGGLREANQGDFFVRLSEGERRPVDEVMDDIRERVEHLVPGFNIEMMQLMEDVIGDLTAVPQPVEIKIFADDPAALSEAARRVAATIGEIDGVVDVNNGINPAGDALEIRIDPVRAALEGMDPAAIGSSLDTLLTGTVATNIATEVKMIGVRVWTPQELRNTDSDLRDLVIRAPDGHLFPLLRVAQIRQVIGQPQITRENLKRMVAVTARISGRDMGSVMDEVKQVLGRPDLLPGGSYFELGGLYAQQQIAFRGLLYVFVTAAALVFLLLLFLYESFRIALSILLTALLAVCAVFVGLWLTGTELNITAMMGMTMIIGMVTEVAIFYYSEQQELLRRMPLAEALVSAGVNRIRPIAMTTLTAILTLVPLALAIGEGAEMLQPLAIAIISGLSVQLALVLLLMPVLIFLLYSAKERLSGPLPELTA